MKRDGLALYSGSRYAAREKQLSLTHGVLHLRRHARWPLHFTWPWVSLSHVFVCVRTNF